MHHKGANLNLQAIQRPSAHIYADVLQMHERNFLRIEE